MDLLSDKSLTTREYIEDVHLFKSGDEAKEAFLIYSGEVRVYKKEDNVEHEIAVLEPGDIVGEMALIQGIKHKSNAVAKEKSVVVIITKDVLQTKLDEADPLLKSLIHMLVKRLYSTNEKI